MSLRRLMGVLIFWSLIGCASLQVQTVVHSYSGPKGVATMYDAPCTEPKVLVHIPPQYRAQFKAGEGTYEGPKYALCWAPHGGGVIIVWEDGGFGRLDAEALQGGVGT